MARIEDLKGRIEEKREKKPEKKLEGEKPEAETIDMSKVESIVRKMKQKYAEQGMVFEEVEGRLGELRGIIAESSKAKIDVQTVETLTENRNLLVKSAGKFYLRFSNPLGGVSRLVSNFPAAKELGYYIYSADMKYSLHQYLAITTVAAVVAVMLGVVLGAIVGIALGMGILISAMLAIALGFLFFIVALIVMFLIPKSAAKARGEKAGVELPFALRHMSTELKAGIGLYRTIQAIAAADYGPLSEEFGRTISEIEEGTETRLALKHFALRTQSNALSTALMHVIRAMKTGGNLSNAMSEMAEDVSFELRTKMKEFSEKMNFFGVIFIMMAIVLPVFIAILAGIRNAPIGTSTVFSSIPLGPLEVGILYLIAMPIMLAVLVMFLIMTQPKV